MGDRILGEIRPRLTVRDLMYNEAILGARLQRMIADQVIFAAVFPPSPVRPSQRIVYKIRAWRERVARWIAPWLE